MSFGSPVAGGQDDFLGGITRGAQPCVISFSPLYRRRRGAVNQVSGKIKKPAPLEAGTTFAYQSGSLRKAPGLSRRANHSINKENRHGKRSTGPGRGPGAQPRQLGGDPR